MKHVIQFLCGLLISLTAYSLGFLTSTCCHLLRENSELRSRLVVPAEEACPVFEFEIVPIPDDQFSPATGDHRA